MMKQIFPSANEKRELQEQARADMELQLQMKEEIKKQALIDELEHAEALQQHVQLTQYVEADHKTARREYLAHLMEQNKKLVDYRNQVKTQEKKAEIVEDRSRPDYLESLYKIEQGCHYLAMVWGWFRISRYGAGFGIFYSFISHQNGELDIVLSMETIDFIAIVGSQLD